MNEKIIKADNERLTGMMQAIDKCLKRIEKAEVIYRPVLGGERYLTDKELSERLKVSRRTLQEYRNERILPYILLGGKVLYRESDIEQVLRKNYRRAMP